MENNAEHIYQKLIEDNHFIEWVKSNRQLHNDYWADWMKNNPEAEEPLRKAIQTVRFLGLKGEQLEPSLVAQEWDEVKSRISRKPARGTFKLMYSKIQYAAAVLFIPILLFSAYLIYQNSKLQQEKQMIADAQTGIMHTVEAAMGAKVTVELPDSSKVLLNSGSSLKYPARFASDQREVELKGEGYFEIEKSQTPFLVKNAGPSVKVYGTEFNLDAYDETHVTLALVEGKVSVLHQNQEYFVKPGQLASYNSYSEKLSIKNTELDEYTSWKEGYHLFREKPLELILQKLKYRYNCKFIMEDKELGAYRYNGKIKDVGLEQLLHLLSFTGPIDYRIEKSNSSQDFDGVTVRIKKKN